MDVCKSVSLYVSVERKKEAKKERSVDIWLLFMAYQPFVLRIMCRESVSTVFQGHLAADARLRMTRTVACAMVQKPVSPSYRPEMTTVVGIVRVSLSSRSEYALISQEDRAQWCEILGRCHGEGFERDGWGNVANVTFPPQKSVCSDRV